VGVVTYFAVNVTSTRVQEENLALSKQHVWFDSASGKAQAAIMVINAGGRDVAIGKVTVRGQVCAWSKVFYTTISGAVTTDLTYSSTLTDGCTISVGGKDQTFKKATTDITVQSGKTLIIYMDNPDSISVNDVGLTVSVNIFTSQAMYYKETNVQGTSGATTSTTGSETPSDEGDVLKIVSKEAIYSSGTIRSLVSLNVTNVSSYPVTVIKEGLIVVATHATSSSLSVQTDEGSPVPKDSYPIQPGENVLLLFMGHGTFFSSDDIDNPVLLDLYLGGGDDVIVEVTVNSGWL
jgi:hypothetical protein